MKESTSGRTSFASWIGDHASALGTLGTLDFRSPVDDLEPLRDIVGPARVVALGESSHHLREFYQVRHRILRFLVERCGFEVYALEAPFTQGQVLDGWVRGGPGTVEQVAADGIALSLGQCREMHEALTWMRELEEAVDVVRRFHDPVTFAALGRYQALGPIERDVLTSALSRLMAHLRRMASVQRAHGHGADHDTATWHLRGAWYLDQLHRANAAEGFESASTFRDVYMAESVLRLLEGGQRVVLAAHNWHIQRTPAMDSEENLLLPAGAHLAAALGNGYRAIGVTSSLGRTATLGEPTPERPQGAWCDAASFQHTRMADYFLDMPVFDAIAHVSRTTGTDHVVR
ncbi:erythromycin esterase family protein [Nonomuraea sp. NPDC049480]|uniref:erythromycin esterase family protein n=1 Tax=Nonomuraea sp. NPDC049480 TaxID=3364353 RepID=UPI0037A9AA7B